MDNAANRLIIVSNRLPLNFSFEEGVPHIERSVGGLATGLSSFLESVGSENSDFSEYLWVGRYFIIFHPTRFTKRSTGKHTKTLTKNFRTPSAKFTGRVILYGSTIIICSFYLRRLRKSFQILKSAFFYTFRFLTSKFIDYCR